MTGENVPKAFSPDLGATGRAMLGLSINSAAEEIGVDPLMAIPS